MDKKNRIYIFIIVALAIVIIAILVYSYTKSNAPKTSINNIGPSSVPSLEAITQKTPGTSTPSANASSASATSIKTGSTELPKNLESLQADAKAGKADNLLTPLEAAKKWGTDYGFQSNDTFTLKTSYYNQMAGTYLATVEAVHSGKTYTIELIQPVNIGDGGIWVINSITEK